jgi:choline dehydrogenase-like flavoprotein
MPLGHRNKQDYSDVVIVGAGPSAAVAAKRLAESGYSVVCLEQGAWPDYSRARTAKPEHEINYGREWEWQPNIRKLAADYPINDSESDLPPLMYNGVGGGTVLYAAHWMRNLPSDFRVWTLDGVAEDWPLTYEDLQPYYERVEDDFGVSGLGGDPAFPPDSGPPLPPVPLGSMGRLVAQAHNKLGWHWWPGNNAIATKPHGALKPCLQRSSCMWGCVDGAKGSVDRTHWPANVANGVQLITGARVTQIPTDQRGRATGAIWIDRDGIEYHQRAAVTIICANGVGTPRLLLMSASKRHPDGLANSSGLVGKRLMMHPLQAVTGYFDEDLGSWQGVWGQQLVSNEFYETNLERGFVRGAKWGLQPAGGLISATRRYPWGDHLWGKGFHEEVAKRIGRGVMWGIIAEDLPEETNTVTLDDTLTDCDGLPAPKSHYRLSDNTRQMFEFNVARAKESLETAGAIDVVVAPRPVHCGHLLGTCTMGDNPDTSVVDGWGRLHDVGNLYIFDGSIWPTSGGTNPTATIAALSLRNTEHLIAQRGSQVTPS